MALSIPLLTGIGTVCQDCGGNIKMDVIQGLGGFYVASSCFCSQHGRESKIFGSLIRAEQALMRRIFPDRNVNTAFG